MPQMSPLMWFSLYFYFLFLFLVFMVTIYFLMIYLSMNKYVEKFIMKKFFYFKWY